MATGTSVSSTTYGIINDAMVDAGLLQEGQQANSDQLAKFMRRLNDIINLWQTYGLKLWLQQEIPFSMVAGQSIYTFGPSSSFGAVIAKPSRVLQGYVIVGTGGQQVYVNIPINFGVAAISVGDSAQLSGPGATVTGYVMALTAGPKSSTSANSTVVTLHLNSPLPWTISQINGNIAAYTLTDTTNFSVFNFLTSILTGEGVRRPLVTLSVDEWERLGQVVGNNGPVNSYMVQKLATSLQVNLWPTPDSTEALNVCILLFQVQPTNPLQLTDSVAFPQEWRIALRWALAEDICTGQPQTIVDRCANNAKLYREQLESWDVEDAPTYFNVDMRMRQGYGRFR